MRWCWWLWWWGWEDIRLEVDERDRAECGRRDCAAEDRKLVIVSSHRSISRSILCKRHHSYITAQCTKHDIDLPMEFYRQTIFFLWRSVSLNSRLRSHETHLRPSNHTERYWTFVNYALSHYQIGIFNTRIYNVDTLSLFCIVYYCTALYLFGNMFIVRLIF